MAAVAVGGASTSESSTVGAHEFVAPAARAPVGAPVAAPAAPARISDPMSAPIAKAVAPAAGASEPDRMPQSPSGPPSSSSSTGLGNPYVEASFWVSLSRMQNVTEQLRFAGSPDHLIRSIEDSITTMRQLLMTHRSGAALQLHHAATVGATAGATAGRHHYDYPPRV